mgnify:CR=1 FL=1
MARMSVRRKLAIATWSAPREGNIYGKLTVDARPALAYVEQQREATGEKITITHVVGAAVARAAHGGGVLKWAVLWHRRTQTADGGATTAV